ncbi:glucose-6-phosphate dehydrogenase [Aureococcus anophagefferens]|nr:glucose-6-phosphate dehydrogenase [Aureococcus anophagefferens]
MNDAPETSTPDAPSEVEKLRSRVAELELRLRRVPRRLSTPWAGPPDVAGHLRRRRQPGDEEDLPDALRALAQAAAAAGRRILGYARADLSVDDFRKRVYRAIYDSAHAQRERASFLERCAYVAGQFDDAAHVRGRLRPELERLEADQAALALRRGGAAARVRVYYMALGALLREDEAYRIDHYLGKELVMNVLVLRFANVCFEGIWDRSKVARVDICCFETISTLGRGGYFDAYGIIRDVLQNHLAQILALALVAMEQPLSFGAADVKREKVKVLRSVRPLDAEHDLVVGQFDGYADDPSVADKATTTETFAAARLYIDNPRWAGVPFVLSAGKALEEKKVEVIRVQPDECIYWRVMNRVPGLHTSLKLEPRRMNLLYTPSESRDMPDAYERLLLEALRCVEINHW